jgi:endoribonuclease LACTB2
MTGVGNNTYLLVGSAGSAVLVDAGVGDRRHLAAIASALAEKDARLVRVVVTHRHDDHISGAPAIATMYPGAAFSKFPHLFDNRDGVEWGALADGDRVELDSEGLEVLHTPGHSPDHLALWHRPTAIVFAGDLVVEGGSVMIDSSGGGDMRQYLASLERLRALRPKVMLPAHGREVADPPAVLAAHLDHRRMRERQVLEALEVGRASPSEIAEYIYHGLDSALWPAALENVRAHLEKLRSEGRVCVEDDRWRV